jgi:hypothetical protein
VSAAGLALNSERALRFVRLMDLVRLRRSAPAFLAEWSEARQSRLRAWGLGLAYIVRSDPRCGPGIRFRNMDRWLGSRNSRPGTTQLPPELTHTRACSAFPASNDVQNVVRQNNGDFRLLP